MLPELNKQYKEVEAEYKEIQEMKNLEAEIANLKKELAWAFPAEKEQVHFIALIIFVVYLMW